MQAENGAAWPHDSVILMVTMMTPGMDALWWQHSWLVALAGLKAP